MHTRFEHGHSVLLELPIGHSLRSPFNAVVSVLITPEDVSITISTAGRLEYFCNGDRIFVKRWPRIYQKFHGFLVNRFSPQLAQHLEHWISFHRRLRFAVPISKSFVVC